MALRVFISYSHRDERLKDLLLEHLLPLQRLGHVDLWHDRRIEASEKWREEIDRALADCDLALLLISASFLASTFCMDYEVPEILERHAQAGVRVVPVILRPCQWDRLPWLAQFQALPKDGKPVTLTRPYDKALTEVAGGIDDLCQSAAASVPPRMSLVARGTPISTPVVSVGKLPTTGEALFGRDHEVGVLNDAWADGGRTVRLVAIVGPGGTGKSAIVNHWLREMENEGYRGARRVFAWSFYSQGQREGAVSADAFIDEALRFFGDPDPSEGNAWQRGERLAQLTRRWPTLLVLDGLEPLQSYEPGNLGKVKDPALETLLRELARGMNGLCVITTRVEPTDIALSEGGPARRVDLTDLTVEAGEELLRGAGMIGSDHGVRQAVKDFGGHALALVLLAEYLGEFCESDISRRSDVPLLDKELEQGGHAWRVMEAYDLALKRDGREAERAVLRIIGSFDRPAAKACVDALRKEPAIPGVTEAVVGLSEVEWSHCLARLRKLRLISPAATGEGALDAHPLVREYFGRKLWEETRKGSEEAHGRLYEYLRDHGKPTPDTDDDTLEDLMPLFQAVHHGCRAGRHQEAAYDVLQKRIRRGREQFSIHKLGAWGADLAALGGFFEERWTTPVAALKESDKAWVLNEAGFNLRALGRLEEAVEPMRLALAMAKAMRDWEEAAGAAGNLADVLISLGRLDEAAGAADEAVGLADESGDAFQRFDKRGYGGAVAHARGRLADAARHFEEAERMQEEHQPEYPLLYSLRGAQYCWLLLDLGCFHDVQSRASTTLPWVTEQNWLLDVGLDDLSLGRASHLLALAANSDECERLKAEAREHLDAAVETLRRAGQQDYVPYGLTARAAFHRDFREREGAERDLSEVLDLSTRMKMRLHETDARLLEGQMALDGDSPDVEAAGEALERARKLVEETGYHRRDADVLVLEGRLLGRKGETEAGKAKLEEAVRVARREEAEGYVYQVAVDQAERYLKEMG